MGIFKRNKEINNGDTGDLSAQLKECSQRRHFYHEAIQALFLFLKEFTIDLPDIDANAFRHRVDSLSKTFTLIKETPKLKDTFDKQREDIHSFISSEKEYLQNREAELKSIVEFLVRGIAEIGEGNEVFNQNMYERSLKVEKITYLDDIRKIKEELKTEVTQMKRAVQQKQMQDSKRMELLSARVKGMKVDLGKAKKASLTDGLTGAYNRAAFDNFMKQLEERNRKERVSCSVLMLDIDDFKQINDTYGHQIGDRVLFALVEQCKSLIRDSDFIARYGGEEFAILLMGTSVRNAIKKANSLCKKISKSRYSLNRGEGSKEKLSFTVSIGVGEFMPDDTVESVIDRADKALYQAKRKGKNRVVGG